MSFLYLQAIAQDIPLDICTSMSELIKVTDIHIDNFPQILLEIVLC